LDYIYLFNEGEIYEQGTYEDIKRTMLFKELSYEQKSATKDKEPFYEEIIEEDVNVVIRKRSF